MFLQISPSPNPSPQGRGKSFFMTLPNRKTKYTNRDKGSLTLLVLILGVLSLISAGIIALSAIKQWSPQWAKAAVNKELNYQGKLQDSSGVPVADGAYNIIFTIYDAAAGGNVVWSARESDACGAAFNPSAKSVTISNGVFSTLLGESGDCAISINFSASAYFLGVTVGADAEMTPRKRIGASLYSFNADMLDDLDESAFGQLAQNETVTGSWSLGDANTDTLTLTAYINSDLYLGANAETLSNAFSLDGDDAFIAGTLGVEGTIYTDTSFIAGNATTYGTSSITTTGAVDFTLNPAGGDVFITDDNFIVDTSVLYVSAGDNRVGINNDTPSYGLDVVSTDSRTINSENAQASGYAGYFASSGTTAAYGIYANASGATGTNYGVYGTAASTTAGAAAGYFEKTGATGATYGVYGSNTSATGYAGYFTATDAVGINYGIYSITASAAGYAGYFSGGKGLYVNDDLWIGASSESITNAGFTLSGNDAYVADLLGVGGSVYAETSFIAGNATTYGANSITTSAANLDLHPFADVTIPNAHNLLIDGNTLYVNTTTERIGINTDPTNTYSLDVTSGASADTRTINALNTTAAGTAGYFTASGTGVTYGIYSVSSGTGANYGIYGSATGNGANFGVYGLTSSASGYSGYFTGGLGVYTDTAFLAGATTNYGTNSITTSGGDLDLHPAGNVTIHDGHNLTVDDDFIVDGTTLYVDGVTGNHIGIGRSPTDNYTLDILGAGTDTRTINAVNSNASGYGGYFVASGATGYAGYFEETDATNGVNYGIYAKTSSFNGTAGRFEAASTANEGTNYGINVSNASHVGVGGHFVASGSNATAGFFEATDTDNIDSISLAISARSYSDNGKAGYFVASGSGGTTYALHAVATGATGTNYAIYGTSASDTGYGAKFSATGSAGVAYGIYTEATGAAGTNYGIYSSVTSGTGTAGYFIAPGATATAGYFTATDAGNNDQLNYGIYSTTASSNGYAGYFTGGLGLYANRANIGRTPYNDPGDVNDDSPNELVIEGSLCVDDGTPTCLTAASAGTIYAEALAITEIDLAENYSSSENLEPGDVVSIDPNNNEKVIKSKIANDNTVMGIVSTKPGMTLGRSSLPDLYPVALAGRVPVKISNENGPIIRGDKLTSSSTPGVAMKADHAPYIGLALEPFNEPSGTIIAFVSIDWSSETDPGSGEVLTLEKLTGDLDANNFSILNIKKIAGINNRWSIDENGVLKINLTNNGFDKEMFGLTSTDVELTLSGSGKLQNGEKIIDLSEVDENFVKNISDKTPLKVMITLTEAGNGIYIAEKTQTSFKIKELNGGMSNSSFDWLVIARRSGYDDPVTPQAEPAPAPSVESPPAEASPAESPAPAESEPEAPAVEPAPTDGDEPPAEAPPVAPEAPAVEASEEVAPSPVVEAPAPAPEAPAESAPAAE